jgi:hypothetical protein
VVRKKAGERNQNTNITRPVLNRLHKCGKGTVNCIITFKENQRNIVIGIIIICSEFLFKKICQLK